MVAEWFVLATLADLLLGSGWEHGGAVLSARVVPQHPLGRLNGSLRSLDSSPNGGFKTVFTFCVPPPKKVVKLPGGGSANNGATPSSLFTIRGCFDELAGYE